MAGRITDLRIIQYGKSGIEGTVNGVYECLFNGKKKVFIQHGEMIGVVNFYYGEPLSKCIPLVCDDVAEELIKAVEAKMAEEKEV